MISLKQLRYALAAERHLHFRKAADEMAISQSALSTALQELEKQLGFQVFERDNKKVLITALGRRFLDQAQRIQLELEDVMKLARSAQTPLCGELRLGMIPTVAPYLLPLLLPVVQQHYPDLQLTVVEDTSDQVLDQVRRGQLDSAVLALPFTHDGLLAFEFHQENFHWVTHRDDPAASRHRIQAKALQHANLLLLSEGHCLKDHALAACRLPRQSPHSLSATSLHTLVQMVAGGLGSTLVPEMALAQLVRHDERLTSLPLDEPGPHRRLAFCVRPNYPGLHEIEALRKLCRQTFSEHPA